MKQLLIIALLSISLGCQSQDTKNSHSDLVSQLSTLLRENYVLEKEAILMAELLNDNLEMNKYAGLSLQELSDLLQSDLREINNDKHLRIRYGRNRTTNPRREIPRHNYGMSNPEILDGNIGYIELTGFPSPNSQLKTALADRMTKLQEVDALIIDMRNNGGGSPDCVRLICSYFFSQTPILLNSLYFRNRDFTRDYYTLKDLEGPRLVDTPIYLLTSDYTFSGGEEFVYNLKHLKRATLVGETTGGGAHPVDLFEIGNGVTAIIPVGRAINPITGTSWEGVGVKPHHLIDEGQALQKALELIKEKR